MKRHMDNMQLSSRGARVHFGTAIALISVIPCLTLYYLHRTTGGAQPLTPTQWAVAALGIAGAMCFGYVLLGRYPATIIRLRTYLHSVAQGDLPEDVKLSASERDILSIEHDLNVVVDRLRSKLHEAQAQKIRLEDELFQAQKLEAIGTLAAGIAHEINTPLQFVSNNAQFLSKAFNTLLPDAAHDPTTPTPRSQNTTENAGGSDQNAYLRAELPRAFDQLNEGVRRIADIVKAVRDFSKGGADETKTPLDLNKAVRTTLEVTRNEWKYHAALETDLDPTLPPVTCFPGEIKRALMDLIMNATQAIVNVRRDNAKDKGMILVATHCTGTEVLLSVKDNGCGIPESMRSRIFDPFFTTREIGAGKGCGLTFAQAAIVQRHGGRLTFATEEGKGTTFTISLPLDEPAPNGDASRKPEPRSRQREETR